MLAEIGARLRTAPGIGSLLRNEAAASNEIAATAKAVALPDDPKVLAPGVVSAPIGDAIEGRRILIFTMHVNGSGHITLAKNIERDIVAKDPTAVVKVIDGYDKPAATAAEPTAVKKFLGKFTGFAVEKMPWTATALHGIHHIRPGIKAERAISNMVFGSRVRQHIDDFKPDVVVSTHERMTAPLGYMKRSGELKVPTVVALYDSAPHGLWMAPGADAHMTYNPSDLARLKGVFAGGKDEAVRATVARPPVDPRMLQNYDKVAVRESFGLPTDKPVALMSGGATGIAVPDAEIQKILDSTDMHIAIATGKNVDYLTHLQETFPKDRLTAIPFTKDMPALLKTSDVAVLNSNGATSWEAFAGGTPVVMFNAYPGHGVGSAKALQQDDLVVWARDTDQLSEAFRAVSRGDAEVADRAARAKDLFDDRHQSMADVVLGARLAQ